MWIGVCDDDPNFCNVIVTMLNEFLLPDDQVSVYHSGFQLLDAVLREKIPIDLILLDIEMPGLSGLETAVELREMQPGVFIIIITNYMRYALKAYEVQAFHYLLKPLDVTKLKKEIDHVRQIVNSFIRDVLYINTKEASFFVPLIYISYMESRGRIITVHTPSREYYYYKRIHQLDNELNSKGFFRIHKSYIVNLINVSHINRSNKQLTLTNGTKLPVAPTKINDLISVILEIRKMGL